MLYERDSNLVMRRIAGETLLIPVRRSVVDLRCIYTLDEVGGAIWESLGDPRTLSEIVQVVLEQFDTDAETAQADVETFLADLTGEGLVRAVSE